MNAKTDAPPPAAPSASVQRKPRFALFIATVCGLGYIPIAPGTFGSLVGVALTYVNIYAANANLTLGPLPGIEQWTDRPPEGSFFNAYQFSLVLLILVVGLWAAHQAANYFGEKDPQRVVVDEVSGQTITYLGLLTAGPIPHGWKYLLLGFILFRVFDIWKPFPARQAERLPGGWGIMADDWVAGIYAALGLWIARAFLHL